MAALQNGGPSKWQTRISLKVKLYIHYGANANSFVYFCPLHYPVHLFFYMLLLANEAIYIKIQGEI